MSMLAEPRSRQKWSQDPRNTNWSRDTTKFGYQMLTKMGWSEGKGLGQKLSGSTSHIRVNKIGSSAGLGSKKSHDDDWISHQDDFNALLSSLNQGSSDTSNKLSSLESKVKSSKKKILYKRFIKSKDLSNASSQDLACIFGQRSQSAPVTPQISDDESKSDSECSGPPCTINNGIIDESEESSIKTIDSQLSIADYFAKKMAALKQKKDMIESTVDSNTSSTVDNVEDGLVKKKKKKKRKHDEVEDNSLISESSIPESSDKVKKRKKEETDEVVLENGLVKKKKKKKKSEKVVETDTNSELVQQLEDSVVIKKKKKKKKKKQSPEPEGENEIES